MSSFCRLQDMVFYVYTKSRSGHPRKFIDCEDLVDIQPGSLLHNEFRLIDKNKHEYKLRALTQPDFQAWVKAFQAALARRQRAANKAVKVWFMDISNVPIIIERGITTAEDVRNRPFLFCLLAFVTDLLFRLSSALVARVRSFESNGRNS